MISGVVSSAKTLCTMPYSRVMAFSLVFWKLVTKTSDSEQQLKFELMVSALAMVSGGRSGAVRVVFVSALMVATMGSSVSCGLSCWICFVRALLRFSAMLI